MKFYKIAIPKPCHENWESMNPDATGRFCQHCEKSVIDFTGMADNEVKLYLETHRNKQICGRFTPAQLENKKVKPEFSLTLLNGIQGFRQMFVVALFMTMGTTLFSCKGHDDQKMGELELITPDSLNATDRENKADSLPEASPQYIKGKVNHTEERLLPHPPPAYIPGNIAYPEDTVNVPTPPVPETIEPGAD